ncbi:TerB family tellurite resistance protein [Frigidibacter sp. MR17.14]|uniref:tellurite resistance TerB family protein n=1 Tax=Frigidibacter sp. MR17.14 TaxID=3126509 RepID=UPI003012C0BF
MEDDLGSFRSVERVVQDDLRFRLKLGIGEDAYWSMKSGKLLTKVVETGAVGAAGAAVAGSGAVASTFFSASGILASLGMGAAAVTPVGWVAAAAVVCAGSYLGVTRLAERYGSSRVSKIPAFINTPVDVLGMTIVDMIGTVAIKIASIDGVVLEEEREAIIESFVLDWGIDEGYASAALGVIEETIEGVRLQQIGQSFGAFVRDNPDCNAEFMVRDVLALTKEIAAADGTVSEVEEMALAWLERSIWEEAGFSTYRMASEMGRRVQIASTNVGDTLASSAEAAGELAKSGLRMTAGWLETLRRKT